MDATSMRFKQHAVIAIVTAETVIPMAIYRRLLIVYAMTSRPHLRRCVCRVRNSSETTFFTIVVKHLYLTREPR